MGNSRIRIQVANAFQESLSRLDKQDGSSAVDRNFISFSNIWSGDSTIRQVVHDMGILDLLLTKQACLWDCSSYPPRDITNWPIDLFSDTGGLKSKTLYDAGWYPSGYWQVLPVGEEPAVNTPQEDSQFNYVHEFLEGDSSQRVQLLGSSSSSMLPSQVLESVAKRFEGDNDDMHEALARQQRFHNQKARRAKQSARWKKLEERIHRLDEATSTDKNKNVSEQVQRMLIKSRATGRSDLKMQDRLYFRCILDDGESLKEVYRYFSPQDTVGKILATFDKPAHRSCELLVRAPSDAGGDTVYVRLPVLIRLYEAASRNVLAEFDKLVVRQYDSSTEEATGSIDDLFEAEKQLSDVNSDTATNPTEEGEVVTTPIVPRTSAQDIVHNPQLADALRVLDLDKTKKKRTSATEKVRQMQMKSKAKGDAKRVKMEERFFVDLVIAVDRHGQLNVSVAPVFIGKSDNLKRLVTDCAPRPAGNWSYELLLPRVDDEGITFQRLDELDMSLADVEGQGSLKCFDRLIVHFYETE